MKTFEDYRIDGLPLPVPDGDVEQSFTDLESQDSDRDESGTFHRFVVRHRLASWSFQYSSVTAEEYAYLRSLFAGKADFAFTYRDAEGVLRSCRAYCSGESISYHNAKLGIYKNLKFEITEC